MAFMLAGSGVGHFDRRFLAAHTPTIERAFWYPVLDVGVMRRMLQYAGREDLVPPLPESGKAHRALADARFALECCREYVDMFRAIREGD